MTTAKTVSKTEKDHYIEAVGRRKTAIARVRLLPNQKGVFLVNNKPFTDYFKTEELQLVAQRPLTRTEMTGVFSITAKIVGGGAHSQAEALSHSLARALLLKDANFKAILRGHGLLTRDAREKERRKFGLKKARKSPQWSKR